jgi:hypothetical protein
MKKAQKKRTYSVEEIEKLNKMTAKELGKKLRDDMIAEGRDPVLDFNKMVRSMRDDIEMDWRKIIEIIVGLADRGTITIDERENLLDELFGKNQ